MFLNAFHDYLKSKYAVKVYIDLQRGLGLGFGGQTGFRVDFVDELGFGHLTFSVRLEIVRVSAPFLSRGRAGQCQAILLNFA